MTPKQSKIFDKMHEAILVECSIQCQKCKKEEKTYSLDDFSFADKLIKNGWTYNRDKILCNECK